MEMILNPEKIMSRKNKLEFLLILLCFTVGLISLIIEIMR